MSTIKILAHISDFSRKETHPETITLKCYKIVPEAVGKFRISMISLILTRYFTHQKLKKGKK